MNIYHGTDKKSAEKILREGILKGNSSSGPGVCLNVTDAIDYALRTRSKHHARVIVIEGLPAQVLNTASKSIKPETFTLNNEFNEPLKGLPLSKIKILTISEAEEIAKYEKVKVYDENEEN